MMCSHQNHSHDPKKKKPHDPKSRTQPSSRSPSLPPFSIHFSIPFCRRDDLISSGHLAMDASPPSPPVAPPSIRLSAITRRTAPTVPSAAPTVPSAASFPWKPPQLVRVQPSRSWGLTIMGSWWLDYPVQNAPSPQALGLLSLPRHLHAVGVASPQLQAAAPA